MHGRSPSALMRTEDIPTDPCQRRDSFAPCGWAEWRHPCRHGAERKHPLCDDEEGLPRRRPPPPVAVELSALGPPPVPSAFQHHLQPIDEEDRLRLSANRRGNRWQGDLDCAAWTWRR